MRAIDKLTNNYIKEIKQNLLCPVRQKKPVLKDIANSVKDYAENNNITDINDLYTHFGTPEEVAKSYMSQADIKDIKRKINLHRFFVAVIAVTLSVFALLLICFLIDDFVHRDFTTYIYPAEELSEPDSENQEEESSYV